MKFINTVDRLKGSRITELYKQTEIMMMAWRVKQETRELQCSILYFIIFAWSKTCRLIVFYFILMQSQSFTVGHFCYLTELFIHVDYSLSLRRTGARPGYGVYVGAVLGSVHKFTKPSSIEGCSREQIP